MKGRKYIMRDIDRNINSLFYNNMLENNSSITVLNNFNSSNIELSKFNNVFSFDVNISETGNSDAQRANVCSAKLTKGEYYYRHTLKQVSNDNAQCLFILITDGNINIPFISYYVQSPISNSDTAIFYSNRFLLTSDVTLFVNRIKPIIPAFNIAGTIDIFKRVK